MKDVIVSTQAEFDALPQKFEEYTRIIIKNTTNRIYVNKRENSSVVARENSSVVAWGNSSVEARGNSSVEAWGNSSVEAWGNSSVVARENSSVEAWGNSSVEAWGNSSVVARENSSVEAWGNSSVVARGNSSVEARENSSVEAWGNSAIRSLSSLAKIVLFSCAACWKLTDNDNVFKKSEHAVIIEVKNCQSPNSTLAWLNDQGVEINSKQSVVLYKRVSIDYKTQEGTPNETCWVPGTTLVHPNYQPENEECGSGKFHVCSRPYFCDEFRSNVGDKYVAIEIQMADLYVWTKNPHYPHKIAFRKGTVLHECTKLGKAITAI